MEKREQFAIQILAAMIASGRQYDITQEAFTKRAVEIADKLIDALTPTPQPRRCIKDACEEPPLKDSMYCQTHQPQLRKRAWYA